MKISDDARAFTTERHLATLSTFARDGSIHVVPVGFTLVDDVVRIICSGQSQKVFNVRRNPHATVSQFEGPKWLTLVGEARVLEDGASVDLAVELYSQRYRAPRPNPLRVVLAIDVQKVMASGTLND